MVARLVEAGLDRVQLGAGCDEPVLVLACVEEALEGNRGARTFRDGRVSQLEEWNEETRSAMRRVWLARVRRASRDNDARSAS